MHLPQGSSPRTDHAAARRYQVASRAERLHVETSRSTRCELGLDVRTVTSLDSSLYGVWTSIAGGVNRLPIGKHPVVAQGCAGGFAAVQRSDRPSRVGEN